MRRKSILLSTIGLIIGLLAWRLIESILPVTAAGTEAERLGVGCATLLPGAVVLALMVLAQILARGAALVLDPTVGQETRFLLVNQRVISNTLEQFAVFVPALLALAAVASPAATPAILALGYVFAGARLLFWVGYLRAPLFRAPGMAATGGVTFATLIAACWAWLP